MQDKNDNPGLGRRWDSYQPTKEHTLWIGVGCIVATLVAGFGFGGWVTGGKASQMSTEAAQKSRHELAAAVCAEEFIHAANAATRLKKLKEADWYTRGDMIAATGSATMPDRKEPNSDVAALCAERLQEMQVPAGKLTPASAKK